MGHHQILYQPKQIWGIVVFQIRIFGLCLYIQNMFLKTFFKLSLCPKQAWNFPIAQTGLASAPWVYQDCRHVCTAMPGKTYFLITGFVRGCKVMQSDSVTLYHPSPHFCLNWGLSSLLLLKLYLRTWISLSFEIKSEQG